MRLTSSFAVRRLEHWVVIVAVLVATTLTPHTWLANATERLVPSAAPLSDEALWGSDGPAPTIKPFVLPSFAEEMRALRPAILAAAARHNRPALSGMTRREFAVTMAQILYSEHIGWLDAEVAALRPASPLYQEAQVRVNQLGGANLTVWPANLRPSVAAEILRGEIPLPAPAPPLYEPIGVAGSHIRLEQYRSQAALYAAITHEIADPQMAVEYLAANLERGLIRVRYERVPVSWPVLAAWHNQGIVAPRDIRANRTALDYIGRTAAYRTMARALIDAGPGVTVH
jgi:hypothetical protein